VKAEARVRLPVEVLTVTEVEPALPAGEVALIA